MEMSFALFAGSPALIHVIKLAPILAMLRRWHRRGYERRLLAQFGERDRRDLALTPADIAGECAKPFWRA